MLEELQNPKMALLRSDLNLLEFFGSFVNNKVEYCNSCKILKIVVNIKSIVNIKTMVNIKTIVNIENHDEY